MDGTDGELIKMFLVARKKRNTALDVMGPIHVELMARVQGRNKGAIHTDGGSTIIPHDPVRWKNTDDIAARVSEGKIRVEIQHVPKLHVEPPQKA